MGQVWTRRGGVLTCPGRPDRAAIDPGPDPDPGGLAYDWSDTNLPWAYTSTAAWESRIPAGTARVDLQTGAGDFYTDLSNTVAAAGGRVVVNLPAGVFHLNQFRLIGGSGDPKYSFGFWFPNLAGFTGQGPDKTFIQMDANSMSGAQLSAIQGMAYMTGPLQMGLCRIDGSSASPIFLGGLTFRAADQQMITTVDPSLVSNWQVKTPQPAPHQGVILFANSTSVLSHVRFQGAGRASTSAPPFEMANLGTQYGDTTLYNCEFDGRLSPDLNPARPRRCGPIMGNNETRHAMTDCWMHHSNVSRYAMNDQNRDTTGVYSAIRCKANDISNVHNIDPALNSGQSLGGYTNATAFGWESCNGTINITDCIIEQNDPYTDGAIAQHLQMTSVGTRDPQGGRMHVSGGTFRNTGFPALDGYLCFRISRATYWYRDGYAATLDVKDKDGNALTAYQSTSWPPSPTTLAAAGVTPQTHYLVHSVG